MPVVRPTSASRVRSSITISSSEALPARSPRPLIAHSTWRAPACRPAKELATARPRSLWQCTESTTLRRSGDELVQAAQERGVLVGHRVADGVRDVDRGRALVDRGLQHLGGELDVGAGGVHRAELDVLDQRAGVRDGGARLAQHVLARGLQLVLDVDVGRGDERVHARALGVAHRLGRALDVGRVGACQAGDDRAVHLPRDRLYGLEVTRRGDRESSLDHVHAEPRELLGDLQLLVRR